MRTIVPLPRSWQSLVTCEFEIVGDRPCWTDEQGCTIECLPGPASLHDPRPHYHDKRTVKVSCPDGTVVQFRLNSDHAGYWGEIVWPDAEPIVLEQWAEVIDRGPYTLVILWRE